MADCTCNNFPASLGNVTFAANVGIGTISPTVALVVSSGNSNGDVIVNNTGTRGPGLYFQKSGAFLGQIGAQGNWDVSTSTNLALAAGAGNGISFFTGNNTTSPRAIIDAAGNVGIGTATPAVMLHILGAAEALRLDGGASYSRLSFVSGDANVAAVINRTASKDFYFGEAVDTGKWIFRGTAGLDVSGGPVRVGGREAINASGYCLYAP